MVITVDLLTLMVIGSILLGSVSLYGLGQLLINLLKDNSPIKENTKELLSLLKDPQKWQKSGNYISFLSDASNTFFSSKISLNMERSFYRPYEIVDNFVILDGVSITKIFSKKELNLIDKKAKKIFEDLTKVEIAKKQIEEKEIIEYQNELLTKFIKGEVI